MKNKENWKPNKFTRDNKGRILGSHMHKIIGNAYEPVIRKYSTGRLADLGCGDVPYYHYYKDQITENICVDWSSSTLELSYLDHEADLNQRIEFLTSESFDTIICTDVLEHIYNPDVLFSEMVRLLKPGGKLILGAPFFCIGFMIILMIIIDIPILCYGNFVTDIGSKFSS